MLRSLPSLLVATLPAMALAQCDDSCATANNGVCDATCAIGTDCTDCAEEDRVRDILLIAFGVGTGLGALGLCYWAFLRCRRTSPAPDVEKAVPTEPKKAAPTEPKKAVPTEPKKAAPKAADKDKGDGKKKVKPESRTILGVELQAVSGENAAASKGPGEAQTGGAGTSDTMGKARTGGGGTSETTGTGKAKTTK